MLRNAIIPFHRKIVEISCILDYVCWWLICVVFANQIRQNLYYFTSFDLFAIYKISILKKELSNPTFPSRTDSERFENENEKKKKRKKNRKKRRGKQTHGKYKLYLVRFLRNLSGTCSASMRYTLRRIGYATIEHN